MRKHSNVYKDPWDRDYYRTGSTRPPKQRGGLVAFLLVAILVLGGIASALGVLNVRLLKQLAQVQKPDVLYVFEADATPPTAQSQTLEGDCLPQLGIWVQTVSEFDRRYYQLPLGVLVTEVDEETPAWNAGIRRGDVIYDLGDQEICTQEELTEALGDCVPGQQLQVRFYRALTQERLSVTVTLPDSQEPEE